MPTNLVQALLTQAPSTNQAKLWLYIHAHSQRIPALKWVVETQCIVTHLWCCSLTNHTFIDVDNNGSVMLNTTWIQPFSDVNNKLQWCRIQLEYNPSVMSNTTWIQPFTDINNKLQWCPIQLQHNPSLMLNTTWIQPFTDVEYNSNTTLHWCW
jgi:hypothetical protein